jgi:hypothetical protein
MITFDDIQEVHKIEINPLIWKEIKVQRTRANLRIFQLGEEPEIVYIFESGYTNPQIYHLVFEDGYESLIIHEFLSKQEIKNKFNIEL